MREEPFLIDPALDTPPDSGIAQAALRACRTSSAQRELCAVGYGSDASKLQAVAGVPAVVLGPGSINQAHTANEWVEVRELVEARNYTRRFVASFEKKRSTVSAQRQPWQRSVRAGRVHECCIQTSTSFADRRLPIADR